MKKLNEKSFKLIKICAVLIVFLTCGFYYVLFADEFNADSENVINENVSKEPIVEKKDEKNYFVNEKIDDGVFIRKESEEDNLFENDTKKSNNVNILYEEDNNSQILIQDDFKENIKNVKSIVDGKVNINKANKEELETLKNIGPKVAENIINYRKENGGFFDIEEIKNVKGIGDKKFDTIKNYIFVE